MANFENEISQKPVANEEISGEREKFKDEIAAYKKLRSRIEKVEDLKLNTETSKSSLAFLIEEMKKKNPGEWQNDVGELMKEIDEAEKKERNVGVIWHISERIDSAYIEFLTKRIAEVKDEKLKERVALIKQIAEEKLEFRRKNYEDGQAVGFGGVSRDYIPKWYYLT